MWVHLLLLAAIHHAVSTDQCDNKPCVCCSTINCSPINNTCESGCIDGYTGENCYNPCPVNCVNCWQNNRDMCDTCKDGYHNGYWHDEKHGPWSENCSRMCRPECKSCFRYRICKECVEGYFKNSTYEDCRLPCPQRCVSCISEFDCIKCRPGFFGKNCSEYCGNGCESETCNKRDGHCNCTNNYSGTTCRYCKQGKYGSNCDLDCPQHCIQCYQLSGVCSSCKKGHAGIYCNDVIGTALLGEKCKSSQECTVSNSVCIGSPSTCQCDSKRYYSNGVRQRGSCLDKKSYGKHCNDRVNCLTTGAVCSGKPMVCTCDEGRYHNLTTDSCDINTGTTTVHTETAGQQRSTYAVKVALGSVFSLVFVCLIVVTALLFWRRKSRKGRVHLNTETRERRISHISGKVDMDMSVYDEIPMTWSKCPENAVYMNPYIETPDVKKYDLWPCNRNESEARYEINKGYSSDRGLQYFSGAEGTSDASEISDPEVHSIDDASEISDPEVHSIDDASEMSDPEVHSIDDETSNYSFATEPSYRKGSVTDSTSHDYFILEPIHGKENEKSVEDNTEPEEDAYDKLTQKTKELPKTEQKKGSGNNYDKLRHWKDSSQSVSSSETSDSADDYEELHRKISSDDLENDLESEEDYEMLQKEEISRKRKNGLIADDGYEKPIAKQTKGQALKYTDDGGNYNVADDDGDDK